MDTVSWRATTTLAPLFILALFISSCSRAYSGRTQPRVIRGCIDLRDWDFERDGPVALSGEWEFYWRTLVRPGTSPQRKDAGGAGYLAIPGIWNGHVVNGRKIPGDGYATYRLKLLLNERDLRGSRKLAIMLNDISTAYTLFINGVRAASGGTVGMSPAESVPGYRPAIAGFSAAGGEADILLHVSNFHHRKGGAWNGISAGTEGAIRDLREGKLARDLFLFGSIFIMACYHLLLFSHRGREKSHCYFFIFCILIGLRILVTGDQYLARLFPAIAWEHLLRLEYLTVYVGVPVFFMFMGSLFGAEFNRRIVCAVQGGGLIFSLAVIATPSRIFTRTMQPYQVLSILVCLYGLHVLLLAAARKREGAPPFLAGFIILFAAVINDILHSNHLVHTLYSVPIGLFIFIFSQSFLLARRFSRSSAALAGLAAELESKNARLIELDRLKDEFLEARLKLLQERMNPHFLFNALNTVHALIGRDSGKADLAVIMLADNYRFLFEHSFRSLIPFDEEWTFVANYLELEGMRFSDTLHVSMEREGDFSGVALPPLTVQPVVENSLRHGVRNLAGAGRICVSARIDAGRVEVVVEDNGPGFDSGDIYSRSLGNIRKRLNYFCDDVKFIARNRPEGGARVVISFNREGAGRGTSGDVPVNAPPLTPGSCGYGPD